MPGAGDRGVLAFIDDVLAEAPDMHVQVIEVMGTLPPRLDERTAPHVVDAALLRARRHAPVAFESLLRNTYVEDCSHPRVLAALGEVIERS